MEIIFSGRRVLKIILYGGHKLYKATERLFNLEGTTDCEELHLQTKCFFITCTVWCAVVPTRGDGIDIWVMVGSVGQEVQ